MEEDKERTDLLENGGADSDGHLLDKIEAVGQVIIGELELIGGALTGDPLTQAEGEFNIEAGTIEAEVASDLEEAEEGDSEQK